MIKQKCKVINGIEINRDFKRAASRLEKGTDPLFITGRAGTGKSTLLRHLRLESRKQMAVIAPTGVAALNVGGQTIHSFFGFSPNVTAAEIKRGRNDKLKRLLKKIDIIVIDEISMVRADLMDCIDVALRHHLGNDQSFGGKRMVFFGDLFQLPPVISTPEEKNIFQTIYASPYFFDAKVFMMTAIETIELKKIYRQHDDEFIKILNNIRHNTLTPADLERINLNFQPDTLDSDDGFITLTTTNQAANQINQLKLSLLPGATKTYQGEIRGDFSQRNLPTEMELSLKTGAQVMLLNNDQAGRWVNGSMGQILEINADGDGDLILVQLSTGERVEVAPFHWVINRYFYNRAARVIETEEIGTFRQYPLRLAWAVTIHKSQGKTFDRVIVDLGWGAFSAGQVYVALSRCTSLDGLVLKRPLNRRSVWTDERIVTFFNHDASPKPKVKLTNGQKITQLQLAANEGKIVTITFLDDENRASTVEIKPEKIGDINISGQICLGVTGQEMKSGARQHWRVDRIARIEAAR